MSAALNSCGAAINGQKRFSARDILVLIVVVLGTISAFAAGSSCIGQGTDPDQTIASCTRFIGSTEPDAEKYSAYMNRARAYFAKQRWDDSILDYDFVIRVRPDIADAYVGRGAAYDRKGNLGQAISDYSTAIRIDPKNSEAYGNRGLAHYKRDAYDDAIADFNEAIRLDGNYSVAFNGRGAAYAKKGDQRRAIEDFTKAIRVNKFYAIAYYNRAIAYAKLENFDEAIRDLNAAVRLEDNPSFYNELAWTYVQAGRADGGLQYVEHALRLNPNYANAYDTRGAIYEAMGEHLAAIADFRKALSLDPTLTSSTAALARLAKNDDTSTKVLDVVQLVEQRGWRANLGDMCAKFELPQSGNGCFFQQLSVQEAEEPDSTRAINVLKAPHDGRFHVLIFHLTPLAGEFFVISPDGVLTRTYLRFKGTDYENVSNEHLQDEFNKDVSYWTRNFARLKKKLESSPTGGK